MKLTNNKPLLPQLTAIVLMSVVASYAFQHTQTTLQINGLCIYRYIAYGITVLLVYVSFSHYKKHIGLAFSLALSVVALSPIGQKAIELFPLLAPLLALLMGVTTVLVVPSARGRGFFEFLAVLILPAILAESRIGGSFHLLATTESIGYYELAAVTVSIVGGYFYLRYAMQANLSCMELLSNGGNEKDIVEVNTWCNLTTILIVVGASATAAVLMATAAMVADAIRAAVSVLPLYVLVLAMSTGIALTMILYVFRRSYRENR